jgi:hypothetical protein
MGSCGHLRSPLEILIFVTIQCDSQTSRQSVDN